MKFFTIFFFLVTACLAAFGQISDSLYKKSHPTLDVFNLADTMIQNLKEYKQLLKREKKTNNRVLMARHPSLDENLHEIFADTVKFSIGLAPNGKPGGYRPVYDVYYSIKKNKILYITKAKADEE